MQHALVPFLLAMNVVRSAEKFTVTCTVPVLVYNIRRTNAKSETLRYKQGPKRQYILSIILSKMSPKRMC
jgi:hypothetical protein